MTWELIPMTLIKSSIRKGNDGITFPLIFRKSGKQRKEHISKGQLQAWKQELEELLSQPVRAGFSARYLTSGSVNLADKLVNGGSHEAFLGMDMSNALDDIQKSRTSRRKVRLAGKKDGGGGVIVP